MDDRFRILKIDLNNRLRADCLFLAIRDTYENDIKLFLIINHSSHK